MKSKNATAFALAALALISSAGGVRRVAADSSDALPGIGGSWVAERAFAPRTISTFYGAPRALAVDALGNPHAAYGGDRLYHAFRDDGGWHYEVADPRQGVGDLVALALDTANRAHIVYRDAANSAVRYATNAGGAWATQLVASGVEAHGVAIALDPAGRPRIAYQDLVADELRFATNATGAWATTRLDAGGQTCSIAVGADGKTHVGYALGFLFRPGGARSMRYATDASGRWKSQTVDDSGTEDGFGNSIALDSGGKVHFVYAHAESATRELRHATNATGGWKRDPLTFAQLNTSGWASISVDSADVVHVSAGAGIKLVHFSNASGSFAGEEVAPGSGATAVVARSGGLTFLHHNGSVLFLSEGASGAWTSTLVDASSDPGMGVSLALDAAGKASITQVNSTGSGGTPHTEIDFTSNASGQWATQSIDSGSPGVSTTSLVLDTAAHAHVAYVRGTPRQMRYATNASGSWVAENVGTGGFSGAALALDSQARPRIAFGDSQVRYATRNGAAWTIESVDASTGGQLRIGLALDAADHAHISYSDSNQSVYHATNATGAWVRTTIGSTGDVPNGVGYGNAAIAVDAANRSHVVWLRRSPSGADLVYATDASGSWAASAIGTGAYEGSPSITLDSAGHVHVAGSCSGTLRHLTNASGEWRSAVIDTGADGERQFTADVFAADEGAGTGVVSVAPSGRGACGGSSSIRIAPDGRPRFAYADTLMGDVKFARPDDGSGPAAVTVDWTASAGTAATSDFTPASGTLAWSADDTATKTFAVPLASDADLEGSETIAVALSGASLGPRTTATLVIRDDDLPAGAVGANFLPRLVVVKVAGAKSRLTASGLFDTGATLPLFAGPATLTIGGLTVSVPSTVKTVKGVFRHKADGIDFTLRPSKFGSSRGAFKLVVTNRDLSGLVDPGAPLTLRFDDVAVDGTGQVALTNGKFKLGAVRGTLLAPSVHLRRLSAKAPGGGKDSFSIEAGVGGLGDAPGAAPDVRVSRASYSVTIPGIGFKKSGGRFTFKGGKSGVASATLDYDRETLIVNAKAIDIGTFAQGAQPVVVTIQVGAATRTAVIRMVRIGASLKY